MLSINMSLYLCTMFYIHFFYQSFLKTTLQGMFVSSHWDDGWRNRATWKVWVTQQGRDWFCPQAPAASIRSTLHCLAGELPSAHPDPLSSAQGGWPLSPGSPISVSHLSLATAEPWRGRRGGIQGREEVVVGAFVSQLPFWVVTSGKLQPWIKASVPHSHRLSLGLYDSSSPIAGPWMLHYLFCFCHVL